LAAIFEFGLKFTFYAEQDMTFDAPMVCDVAGAILDPADANASEMSSAPVRQATVACVFGLFDLGPICGAKWDICHLHI